MTAESLKQIYQGLTIPNSLSKVMRLLRRAKIIMSQMPHDRRSIDTLKAKTPILCTNPRVVGSPKTTCMWWGLTQ